MVHSPTSRRGGAGELQGRVAVGGRSGGGLRVCRKFDRRLGRDEELLAGLGGPRGEEGDHVGVIEQKVAGGESGSEPVEVERRGVGAAGHGTLGVGDGGVLGRREEGVGRKGRSGALLAKGKGGVGNHRNGRRAEGGGFEEVGPGGLDALLADKHLVGAERPAFK